MTIAGEKPKKLLIPHNSVLLYEYVPAGKNEQFPDGGTFIRYDFGGGLQFALVTEDYNSVASAIGFEGYMHLLLADGAPVSILKVLFMGAMEVEDDGIELTQLFLNIGGKPAPLLVKESVEEIKTARSE